MANNRIQHIVACLWFWDTSQYSTLGLGCVLQVNYGTGTILITPPPPVSKFPISTGKSSTVWRCFSSICEISENGIGEVESFARVEVTVTLGTLYTLRVSLEVKFFLIEVCEFEQYTNENKSIKRQNWRVKRMRFFQQKSVKNAQVGENRLPMCEDTRYKCRLNQQFCFRFPTPVLSGSGLKSVVSAMP